MNLKTKAQQLKLELRNIKIDIASSIYDRKIDIPIYLFCHHKTGTILLRKIFKDICRLKGWRFLALPGMVNQVPKSYDVVLFSHSLVNEKLFKTPFIGLHVIRDPRDIVVSGYQYHLRTKEQWCINNDFDINIPIKYPQVPSCLEHFSEDWKINYVKSLNGRSYQDNLLTLSQKDGLIFEMNHHAQWTIKDMLTWDYNNPQILEIKFEDLMANFNNTWLAIFRFLKILINDNDTEKLLKIIKTHDLQSKSMEEISALSHVTSKTTSRWLTYFEDTHKSFFIDKFNDALIRLKYEPDNYW